MSIERYFCRKIRLKTLLLQQKSKMNEATKLFVKENSDKNVNEIVLRHHSLKSSEIAINLAIRQIEGRQKSKDKLPSLYNNINILYPQKLSIEQSSSEATAKYKASLCKGDRLIDLTGGLGIDTMAFAEKFNHILYVEQQEELCEIAKHNFKLLEIDNVYIECAEATIFLDKTESADWIYIDPARRKRDGRKAVLLADCEPNIIEIEDKLYDIAPQIMIKLSPMFDIMQLRRELKNIAEIHIVATDNECKEIVVIAKKRDVSTTSITAINTHKIGDVERFTFTIEEEQRAVPTYADTVKRFLYEPNVAILKAGAFKSVGERYCLEKLDTSSHLYTSNDLIADFVGRKFEVKEVMPFNKATIKHLQRIKANISSRNFPLTANEVRERLAIKDGGDLYIFATTINKREKVIILCQKAMA